MQGSNGTKFQSITGSLGQSSFTSPGNLFVPFPVLLPNQQKKTCSSSQCFFTQQESKFSCLIPPQSYWVHSHFCRDLPCEFTCSIRSLTPCFGEAASRSGAVGLVMPHGCCSSTPCTLWYQLVSLRYRHNTGRRDVPQNKAQFHKRANWWPGPEHDRFLLLKNRCIYTSMCQGDSGTLSGVVVGSEWAVSEWCI